MDILTEIDRFFRARLSETSFAVAATLLIIYGNNLNRLVKKFVSKFPFWTRVAVFIFFCSFGYAFLTYQFMRVLKKSLASFPPPSLPLIVLALFVTIGVLAERKRQI